MTLRDGAERRADVCCLMPGAAAQVLQQLGAKGEPSASDLVALLVEAGAALAGRPLNVNEQRAVLRLLDCIVAATPPASQQEREVRPPACSTPFQYVFTTLRKLL